MLLPPLSLPQGVYGCANPGELQGLMGPSGAGKSTLMDLLSKRTDPTGSAAAEAALQHQSLSQKLKTITSHRSSDATGASSSNDGGVTSPVSRGLAAARDSMQSAGLPSRIHAGGPLPHLESELLVNGAPLSRSAFMRLSAYVPQVRVCVWGGGLHLLIWDVTQAAVCIHEAQRIRAAGVCVRGSMAGGTDLGCDGQAAGGMLCCAQNLMVQAAAGNPCVPAPVELSTAPCRVTPSATLQSDYHT